MGKGQVATFPCSKKCFILNAITAKSKFGNRTTTTITTATTTRIKTEKAEVASNRVRGRKN